MKRKTILSMLVLIASALCLAFATHAQPTYAELGIPDQIKPFENCVLSAMEAYTPSVTKSFGRVKFTAKKQSAGFSSYGLNYIHKKVHEENFQFIGVTGGTYKFFKPSVSGNFGYSPAQSMDLYQERTGRWVVKLKSFDLSYRLILSGRWVTYTAEELAALAGVSLDQFYEITADYYYGTDKDPSTHITSWFVTVDNSGGNVFTSELWINFKPASSIDYGSMTTSYGQTGRQYQVRWYVYNNCGGYAGLCTGYGPFKPSDSKAWTVAANYNASLPYAIVECKTVELPDDGKSASTSGYFTVVGCDTDDPCGPARRLPRTPVD